MHFQSVQWALPWRYELVREFPNIPGADFQWKERVWCEPSYVLEHISVYTPVKLLENRDYEFAVTWESGVPTEPQWRYQRTVTPLFAALAVFRPFIANPLAQSGETRFVPQRDIWRATIVPYVGQVEGNRYRIIPHSACYDPDEPR